MTNEKFRGVFTALITPFKEGRLDILSLNRLLDFQLEGGIHSFVVNGTTGESPTLDFDEVKEIYGLVRKRVGDHSVVVVGTGSNCTRKTIELSQRAEDLGADAVLVVTPYYNRPPQEGLVAHFSAISESLRIPIILYNVPSRTAASLSIDALKSLAMRENIVGIKEASGDLHFGQQILKECGDHFLLTSGDDLTCVDLGLAGASGVISVVSHLIPGTMRELMSLAGNGQTNSREKFLKYANLLRTMYAESNPIGVKMALFHMGVIASPELRLPLVNMSHENSKKLITELRNLELIG